MIIVDAISADSGIDTPIPLDKNHLDICKPVSTSELAYKATAFFISNVFDVSEEIQPKDHIVVDGIASETEASRTQKEITVGHSPRPYAAKQLIGRDIEFNTVMDAILAREHTMVSIVGMGGQGKTHLASSCFERLLDHHLFGFWVSLGNAPTFRELAEYFISSLPIEANLKVSSSQGRAFDVIKRYLMDNPCLVVLDNAEALLIKTAAARTDPDFEGYVSFVEIFRLSGCKSSLITTSREKTSISNSGNTDRVTNIEVSLRGLQPSAARELLGLPRGSEEAEDWQKYISRFSGNPLALLISWSVIEEVYGQSLTSFLKEENAVVEDVDKLIRGHLSRLSRAEIDLLFWLAILGRVDELTQVKGLGFRN